jgi:hypothetical protein
MVKKKKMSFIEKYQMTTAFLVIWIFGTLIYMIGIFVGDLDIPIISILAQGIIDPDYFIKWYHMILIGLLAPVIYFIERDIMSK